MKHPYRPTEVTHTVQVASNESLTYIVRTCNEESLRTSYGQTTRAMSPKAERITKDGESCP